MTSVYCGTCAWCFREFRSARDGITQRHGWVEVSGGHLGGRHPGEYGNVSHSNDCGGIPFPPYELSCAGTKARLTHERACLAVLEKRLAYYATRPDFVVRRAFRIDWRAAREPDAEYEVKLVPGDDFEVVESKDYWNKHRFSYEQVLKGYVDKAESEREARVEAIAFCEDKIATWKEAELREYEVRKATVHFKREGARMPYCGSRSRGLHTTADEAVTTCSKCRRGIETAKREVEARDAVKARGMALYDWLVAHGKPASPKEIKAALGFDQKALNSALEAERRRINTNYGASTTTYVADAIEAKEATPS